MSRFRWIFRRWVWNFNVWLIPSWLRPLPPRLPPRWLGLITARSFSIRLNRYRIRANRNGWFGIRRSS